MTDPKTYITPAEEKMELAVAYLDETLARIRAGKANPKILDAVRVEYYGSMAPISNVANISARREDDCNHPVGKIDVQGY